MSTNNDKVDPYYMKQAVEFVDSLFDRGYFSDAIERKDMRNVEELLGYMFQSKVEMAIRAHDMLRTIKDKK